MKNGITMDRFRSLIWSVSNQFPTRYYRWLPSTVPNGQRFGIEIDFEIEQADACRNIMREMYRMGFEQLPEKLMYDDAIRRVRWEIERSDIEGLTDVLVGATPV